MPPSFMLTLWGNDQAFKEVFYIKKIYRNEIYYLKNLLFSLKRKHIINQKFKKKY